MSRMSDIELDPPASAESGGEPVRRSLDPLTGRSTRRRTWCWRCPRRTGSWPRTCSALRARSPRTTASLTMTYAVTNRRVFRYRVYELGPGSASSAPDDVRAEILAELRSFVLAAP